MKDQLIYFLGYQIHNHTHPSILLSFGSICKRFGRCKMLRFFSWPEKMCLNCIIRQSASRKKTVSYELIWARAAPFISADIYGNEKCERFRRVRDSIGKSGRCATLTLLQLLAEWNCTRLFMYTFIFLDMRECF